MRTSRPGLILATLFALFLVLASVPHSSFAEAVADTTRANAAGQPVEGEGGRRIRYGPGELVRAAAAQAAGPSQRLAGRSSRSVGVASPSSLDPADDALEFERVWSATIYGTGIGASGFVVVDLDGDGRVELLAGGSRSGFGHNDFWNVIRHEPGVPGYDIVWSSAPLEGGLTALEAFRIDARTRVFAGTSDGHVQVVDGSTRALEADLVLPAFDEGMDARVTKILLADVDNDGTDELVVVSLANAWFYDVDTLAMERVVAIGGDDAAVGDVDGDGLLEFVASGGTVVRIVGDAEPVVVWSSPAGFGVRIGLADVDDDGRMEIVGADAWYFLRVFDADLKSTKYIYRADLDIDALLLADVTGDGKPEILYGDGQWGDIVALRASDGQFLWKIPNPEHGVTDIVVADLDDDGAKEIAWGAGWTSTGPDYLYVHDVATRGREFVSRHLDGPFQAVARGDVDGDGKDELVYASFSSDSGYEDGILTIRDGETYALEWTSPKGFFGGGTWEGIHDAAVADIDGDGRSEILLATDYYYDGSLFVVDGVQHRVERRYGYEDGSPLQGIVAVDMTGDGRPEVVTANGKAHTGSTGNFVQVVDGVDGRVLWKSSSLGSDWTGIVDVDAADVAGDSTPDIAAVDQRVFLVDGATHLQKQTAATDYACVDLADTDGDGRAEAWAGREDGTLVSLDAELEATTVADLCDSAALVGLRFGEDALVGAFLFACEDGVGIYGLYEQKVLWRSEAMDLPAWGNAILQFDRGLRADFVVGSQAGVTAFRGYGLANPDVDGDGWNNTRDNCPEVANADQKDADGDGIGNACNDESDVDDDEWADDFDDCPFTTDPLQLDTDNDGVGDVCNDAIDGDGDDWSDSLDNCGEIPNGEQADRDGDAVGDVCDPYPDNPDNFRARCEEAFTDVTLLQAELAVCEARPTWTDTDGDGEHDRTDACAGTKPGHPVDAAGCSRPQFCGRLSDPGQAAMRRAWWCLQGDWRNDEAATLLPGDCKPRWKGGPLTGSVRCKARLRDADVDLPGGD